MPSLLPLLSPSAATASPSLLPVHTPKKAPKKLRRRNPPSASTSHQKLPSSAGSSTISLSRPTSSKSNHGKPGGWFSGSSASNPSGSDEDRSKWLPEEHPPLPINSLGVVAPPQSGSSDASVPLSISPQVVALIPPRQQQTAPKQQTPPRQQQTQPHRPPDLVLNKKSNGSSLKAYSIYSNMPVSPPPATPPPGSVQPSYLGTSQYPNNLLPPAKSQTFPTTSLNTNVPPPNPAQQKLVGRTPNGSPILPPLPLFQSGGFGFDMPSLINPPVKPKPSPTYPGRSRYQPSTYPDPQDTQEHQQEQQEQEQHVVPERWLPQELEAEPASFHALTAEEPIVLPSSAEQSPESSPEPPSVEFAKPVPTTRKKSATKTSSFLGGWKLAMSNSRPTRPGVDDEKPGSPENDAPVGVGDGGGWIHRRKGSFSSTRPPSGEKAKHKQFGQEYKEFRAQKKAEAMGGSAASSKRGSVEISSHGAPVEGAAALGATLGTTTIEKSGEKMKLAEARQMRRESDLVLETNGIVGLDVAIRQMNLLEEQAKSGKPPSPPDSRDGNEAPPPTDLEKSYLAGSERGHASHSSSASSSSPLPIGSLISHPAPPTGNTAPSSRKPESKGKSRSPLRNEVGSSPDSPPPSQSKGKSRETSPPAENHTPTHTRDGSKSSSRHSANSQYPPPSEYLGRGARSSGTASMRPQTPPKPIAKLFVICCRCKYWHDLPSVMYRGMVENGGATRCPYCLHGMEVTCCSGYVFSSLHFL